MTSQRMVINMFRQQGEELLAQRLKRLVRRREIAHFLQEFLSLGGYEFGKIGITHIDEADIGPFG